MKNNTLAPWLQKLHTKWKVSFAPKKISFENKSDFETKEVSI